MPVSGLSNYTAGGMSFVEMNEQAAQYGSTATQERSEAADAYVGGSSFGNDTKVGTSPFQQDNDYTVEVGTEKTSTITQRGQDYYEVSNFGNETSLGQSSFQQANAQIMQARQQSTAVNYNAIGQAAPAASGSVDMGV